MSSTDHTTPLAPLAREPLIRKLRPTEAELYRGFLLGLDPGTRRDRFCGAVSDLAVSEHARRAVRGQAVVHGCFVGDRLVGSAELVAGQAGLAEAAFAVLPEFRNRGIGKALLDVAVLAARNRGSGTVRVLCLRTNRAMQSLARRADASLTLTYDDVQGEIRPPAATPLSWLREAFVDGMDAAIYLMRPRAA